VRGAQAAYLNPEHSADVKHNEAHERKARDRHRVFAHAASKALSGASFNFWVNPGVQVIYIKVRHLSLVLRTEQRTRRGY
jgi:hypothetical protein